MPEQRDNRADRAYATRSGQCKPMHASSNPRLAWRFRDRPQRASPTSLVFAALITTVALDASAEPYEIVAQYDVAGTITEQVLSESESLIFRDYPSGGLKEISLRWKSDDYSKLQRASFASGTARFTAGQSTPVGLDSDIQTLARPSAFTAIRSIETTELDIRLRQSEQWLCEQETVARRATKAVAVAPFSASAPGAKSLDECASWKKGSPGTRNLLACGTDSTSFAEAQSADSAIWGRPLISGGRPVVYSFCVKGNATFDGAALVAAKVDLPTERSKLLAIVKDFAEKKTPGLQLHGSKENGLLTDLEVRRTLPLQVVKGQAYAMNFSAHSDEKREVTEIKADSTVDQDAQIHMQLKDSAPCAVVPTGCGQLLTKKLVVYAEYDAQSTTGSKQTKVRVSDANARFDVQHGIRLGLDLRERLRKDLDLVAYLHVGEKEVEISRAKIRVENLGWIVSFPVLSEIFAAYSKHPRAAADLELQGSLPTSYAHDISRGTAAAAVTIPLTIGFNPDGEPRLAEKIRFMAGASLVFPIAQNEPARLLAGPGVMLFDTFALSVGFPVLTPDGSSSRVFFMAGISAPDLIKLLRIGSD